jgi:hypothetical protein
MSDPSKINIRVVVEEVQPKSMEVRRRGGLPACCCWMLWIRIHAALVPASWRRCSPRASEVPACMSASIAMSNALCPCHT